MESRRFHLDQVCERNEQLSSFTDKYLYRLRWKIHFVIIALIYFLIALRFDQEHQLMYCENFKVIFYNLYLI